jgi:hypothetical protein
MISNSEKLAWSIGHRAEFRIADLEIIKRDFRSLTSHRLLAVSPRRRVVPLCLGPICPERLDLNSSTGPVEGADAQGRQEGRPYPWSQQVIHGISGLRFARMFRRKGCFSSLRGRGRNPDREVFANSDNVPVAELSRHHSFAVNNSAVLTSLVRDKYFPPRYCNGRMEAGHGHVLENDVIPLDAPNG